MASLAHDLLPAETTLPSDRQRLFTLFFTGTLIDLVVLCLSAEYSGKVYANTFTTALLAAVILQALLKLTIIAEHRILGRLSNWARVPRLVVAWLILVGSKFVILGTLSLAFGNNLHFKGILHGVIWLILVAVTMLVAEEIVVRFYRGLGGRGSC